jgi:ubiquinone/menaquinone biosynthesis C-methylase UbiE
MMESIRARDGLDFTQCWGTKEDVINFDVSARVNDQEGVAFRLDQMNISKDDRVLDIGAGTGALTIPMSRIAAQVVAIEPSESMLWCLKKNLRDEGITNVQCLENRWEDIIPKSDLKRSIDIIVASYSLGMVDIVDSLMKMDAVAKKAVYLFWFAERNCDADGNNTLPWSSTKGRRHEGKPQSDVLFNILYNLGFDPKVEITSKMCYHYYRTIEEAVDEKASYLNMTDDDEKDKIRQYLLATMKFIDGMYETKEIHRNAVLWWKPKTDSC